LRLAAALASNAWGGKKIEQKERENGSAKWDITNLFFLLFLRILFDVLVYVFSDLFEFGSSFGSKADFIQRVDEQKQGIEEWDSICCISRMDIQAENNVFFTLFTSYQLARSVASLVSYLRGWANELEFINLKFQGWRTDRDLK
jgi:hypothetical protein